MNKSDVSDLSIIQFNINHNNLKVFTPQGQAFSLQLTQFLVILI